MRGAGLVFVLVLASVALLSSRAHAVDRVASSLAWRRGTGAEGCIDAGELTRRVERRLARALVPERDAELRIRGEIGSEQGAWVARISVSQAGKPDGQRELREVAADCRSLDDALVLAITLMIDPDAALGVEPAPPAKKPAKRPPRPPRSRAPRPVAIERWHFGPRVQGRVAAGLLPGAAFGISLGVGAHAPGGWGAELVATRWFERDTDPALSEVGLTQLALALCPVGATATDWHLLACAGGGVSWVTASGTELDSPETDSGLAAFGLLGIVVERRIVGEFWLFGTAGAELTASPTRILYSRGDGSQGLLYEAPIVGGSVGLGVALNFSS